MAGKEKVLGDIDMLHSDMLHRAENPWKPRCLLQIEYSAEETPSIRFISYVWRIRRATYVWRIRRAKERIFQFHSRENKWSSHRACFQELSRKMREILNKMTPQKFQSLICRARRLPINTEQKLIGVVDLIFEKVSMEPFYSTVYANMCRCLSTIKVKSGHPAGKMINFRASLLTRCHKFIKESKSDLERIKDADEATQCQYQARVFCNYRFIGELYNQAIITENIVHDMIFKLLKWRDPISLRCLCILWEVVGNKLDVDKAKRRNDQYFQQISKIANDKKQATKTKYCLLNILDLRANNWVPRHSEDKPKALDLIGRDGIIDAGHRARDGTGGEASSAI